MKRVCLLGWINVLWGTDLIGVEAWVRNVPREFEFRAEFFTPVEQLRQVTGNNGQVLQLTGFRNPYPAGPLGVIEAGAYADMLLVEGDPTEDIMIMTTPQESFKVIMVNGRIYKNAL